MSESQKVPVKWVLVFWGFVTGGLLLWNAGYLLKPIFSHWGYLELVKVQTGIGALIGLLAIFGGAKIAFANAQRHEEEKRVKEAQSLAAVFAADVAMVGSTLELLANYLGDHRARRRGTEEVLDALESSIEIRQRALITYRSAGTTIGLFPMRLAAELAIFFNSAVAPNSITETRNRKWIEERYESGLDQTIRVSNASAHTAERIAFELVFFARHGDLPVGSYKSKKDRDEALGRLWEPIS